MCMCMYTYMYVYKSIYTGQEVDGMPAILHATSKKRGSQEGSVVQFWSLQGLWGELRAALDLWMASGHSGLSWEGSRRSLGCPGHSPGALWK